MVGAFLSRLLGRPSVAAVAKGLGRRLGAAPTGGDGVLRVGGTWNGVRCQVSLDGKTDQMTVTVHAPPQNISWEIRWLDKEEADLTLVSTHVGLSAADAKRMEALPMRVRLHVIEVVEAGRGSLRLQDGTYTLRVKSAGLSRPNAVEQAAIRMDVLVDLVRAAGKAF
jgi:hypothetical protein